LKTENVIEKSVRGSLFPEMVYEIIV